MNDIRWTKETLARTLNTRMDQGKVNGNDFIMPHEISDEALANWQEFYDNNKTNPIVVENEYVRLYQSIIAGF